MLEHGRQPAFAAQPRFQGGQGAALPDGAGLATGRPGLDYGQQPVDLLGRDPGVLQPLAGDRQEAVDGFVALAVDGRGGATPAMRTAHRSQRSIPPRSAFAGFRFPVDVIVLAVRWYLRFGLSYRDVEELLSERGVEVDHVTVYRWVLRFAPLRAEAARPCRHAVGDRWQVDETYVTVAGQWRYVYRAIDQFGQVIDVFVSARRDGRAARRFFEHAIGTTKARPMEVVTDLAPVYPATLEKLLPAA